MKERAKRFLASIVASLTLVGSVPTQVYASELEPDSSLISPQGDTKVTGSDTTPAGNTDTVNDETVTDNETVTDDETLTDESAVTSEDAPGEADTDGGDTEDRELEEALVMSFSANNFSLRSAASVEGENLLTEEASSSEDNQAATPVVKIGETQLGDSAVDTGWNEGSETENASGWRYDGKSVSMVNNGTAVDVHAEGTGIDFSMAGFNRVGTLYADGDVNITGTGILLIDQIDMLDGTNLNLLTNTDIYEDGSGSVAVFLLNKQTGEYELINGNVKGILDEEYTIPEGVTLVVPDGGTLDMRVTTEVTTTTVTQTKGTLDGQEIDSTVTDVETHYGFTAEDNKNAMAFVKEQEKYSSREDQSSNTAYTVVETVKKEASFFTPVLNIVAGAALKIQQGAQLLMQAFRNTIFKEPQCSELNVSGTLELEGTIESYANENDGAKKNFTLNVLSGGNISGSGTMTDVVATYNEGAGNDDTLNLAGDSYVAVHSNGIGCVNNSGTASVVFDDNVSIGNVSSSDGAGVTFNGINATNRLNILGNVTGSYCIDSGYVTVGGKFANETFDSFEVYEGEIPTYVSGDVAGYIPSDSGKPLPSFTDYVLGANVSKMNALRPTKFYTGNINYEAMKSGIGDYSIFEVYTYDTKTGNVTLHLISEDKAETVDKSKVFQIRGISFSISFNSDAGSGLGSTTTSNTGSGILGGSNAGSFQGGTSNSVLGGNRTPSSGSGSGSGDTGNGDTGSGETGSGDTGSGDTGSGETGSGETGSGETGSGDTGNGDTGSGETGSGDTGSGETGSGDTGNGDTGNGDTGSGDTDNGSSSNGNEAAAAHAETSSDFVIKISKIANMYQLSAYLDGVEVQKLKSKTIPVTMEVTLENGWNENDLFAVFRNEKGELVAVKADYDPVTGMLAFDAPMLGRFQLVCFQWDGTDYESEAFLSALGNSMS